MPEPEDLELLAKYCATGSEEAFCTLTERYLNLVFSAAMRQMGNQHMAEDVTQAVFIILSKKACRLRKETILAGWLLRTTRFTAANLRVSQQRRIRREQETAQMQNTSPEEAAWEQMAPLLDETLARLSENDRSVLALRFFENKSLKEVGAALEVDADTARKRVSRAVEKLRALFSKRGITIPAIAMTGALSANAVQAAPVSLLSSVAAVTSAQGAVAATGLGSVVDQTLKLMMWAKVKTAAMLIGASALVAGAAALATISAAERLPRADSNEAGLRLKLPVGLVPPAVIIGDSHGVILASDGSLWTWGTNYLGWPLVAAGQKPEVLNRFSAENDWVVISSSFSHCLALKADGSLWGWGRNLHGELAGEPSARRNEKQVIPLRLTPENDWKHVAAGGAHSVALKNDGTLWSWGNNWAGQLGLGLAQKEVRGITQVGSSTNWQKVWAGALQTVALQSDGSLWFCGSLTGSTSDENRLYVPIRISPDTNWVDVCFGFQSMFAIRADGTLWAWGRDAGIYTGAPIERLNETPVQVGTDRDWKACAGAHYFYQLLQKRNGSLWALDAYENRDNNLPRQRATLKRIDLQKDIVAFGVAGRGRMGVALTRDGEVWTWGKALGEPATLANVEGVSRDVPWRLPNSDPALALPK